MKSRVGGLVALAALGLAGAVAFAPAAGAASGGITQVGSGAAVVAPTPFATRAPATWVTLDAKTGKLVSKEKMTQGEALARQAAEQKAKAAQIAANKRAAGVHLAPAISRHSPCTANTGYFQIWNYPPLVCFANAGAVRVTINSVYEFDTGNNVGGLHWLSSGCGGGVCDSGYWGKNSYIGLNGYVTVNYVYIQ
jgi:hypothetical protein